MMDELLGKNNVIDVDENLKKVGVINLNESYHAVPTDQPDDEIAQSSLRETSVIISPKEEGSFYIEKQSHHKKNIPYSLNNLKMVIGRSPEADVKVFSASISRNHAVLTMGEDGWMLKDTNSTNGVYINGNKLTVNKDYLLNIGDQFSLGPPNDVDFLFIFKQRNNENKPKPTTSLCTSPPRKMARNDNHSFESSTQKKDDEDSELKKKLVELEKQLKQKEESEKILQQKLEEQEKEHEEKLNREREIVMKQKADSEKEMKERMAETVKANEQQLRKLLAAQKQSLLDEKSRVEQTLLQKLNDRDKEIHETLQQEQKRLEKALAASETKASILETQLSESKHMKEQTRSEMISELSEMVETEMNCSICSELFVIAITLGCSHTFCQECITTWKRKKRECPICRNKIKSEARALVIDNFIDKIVENLPAEMKTHRKNLIKEREKNARAAQSFIAQENVAANNLTNYLGMWNPRANEPTVVINRLGIATGMPANARGRGLLDFAQPDNRRVQLPLHIPNTYPNETGTTTRPSYVFSSTPNSHSIQIDANTIVRVVGNLRMPANPPETRVHLERLLPTAMGRFATNQAPITGPIPVIQLPQNAPTRGRSSVLNLAPTGRNAPPPAGPIEPIIISDSEEDTHLLPNQGRSLHVSGRARWARGQHQRN